VRRLQTYGLEAWRNLKIVSSKRTDLFHHSALPATSTSKNLSPAILELWIILCIRVRLAEMLDRAPSDFKSVSQHRYLIYKTNSTSIPIQPSRETK